MIDIGRGDQENFEKKNCGQCPQKIRNYPHIFGFNPDLNLQIHQFHSENLLSELKILSLYEIT